MLLVASEMRLMVNGLTEVLLSVRSPVMANKSHPVPAELVQSNISKSNEPPPRNVVLPALNVPILLPGESVPPTVRAPIWPLPPSEAPLFTVTALLALVPLTTKRPP